MKRSLGIAPRTGRPAWGPRLFVVAWLAGCAGGSPTGGTGGSGGMGGTGGSGGMGGTGGSGGAPVTLPNFETTTARGKIAGKTFEFVTGFVRQSANDATAMDVELLGFSPELGGPCWNQAPSGSNRDLENRVIFRVPRTGGTFTWGGGQNISGYASITLASVQNNTPATQSTDRAKVMIGAWPASGAEVAGSVVVKVDDNNTLNGTFSARRCD